MTNKSIQRALPALISGAITLIAAWPIAHKLGLTLTIDDLMDKAGAFSPAILILWYAMVFTSLSALMRAITLMCGINVIAGNAMIDNAGLSLAFRFGQGVAMARSIISALVMTPLGMLVAAYWKPLEDRVFDLINGFAFERQLREEYRANFRDQFRTFAAFKRAFHGEQESKKGKPEPKDNLGEALSLLGLTDDCTREQLDAQHKKLIRKLHPDVGGTTGLAAAINQARDLIIAQKGWKK